MTRQTTAAEAPVTTTVFVTSDVPQGVIVRLEDAGATVTGFEESNLAEVLEASQGRHTLLWDRPVSSMADALRTNGDPENVAQSWLEQHQSLLRIFRQNRRRLRLVDSQIMSSSSTREDLDILADALGLQELSNSQAALDHIPDAAHLLATLAIPALDMLRDCLDELEASSMGPDRPSLAIEQLKAVGPSFGTDQHLQAELQALNDDILAKNEEIDELRKHAAESAEEISVLTKQINLQIEENERFRERTKAALTEAHDALALEQKKAKSAQKETQAALADVVRLTKLAEQDKAANEEEISTLIDQVHLQISDTARLHSVHKDAIEAETEAKRKIILTSERDLARALADFRHEANERLRLQEENRELAAAVDSFLNSTSWKVTKPLRKIRTVIAPIKTPDTAE